MMLVRNRKSMLKVTSMRISLMKMKVLSLKDLGLKPLMNILQANH